MPFLEIHLIPDAVLTDLHSPDGIGLHRRGRDPLIACHRVIHLEDDPLSAEARMHPGNPRGQPLSDAQAVNLDAQNVGELVDHQATETVGIGVNHPERISHLRQAQEINPMVHGPVEQLDQQRFLDKRFPQWKSRRGTFARGCHRPLPQGEPDLSYTWTQSPGFAPAEASRIMAGYTVGC